MLFVPAGRAAETVTAPVLQIVILPSIELRLAFPVVCLASVASPAGSTVKVPVTGRGFIVETTDSVASLPKSIRMCWICLLDAVCVVRTGISGLVLVGVFETVTLSVMG